MKNRVSVSVLLSILLTLVIATSAFGAVSSDWDDTGSSGWCSPQSECPPEGNTSLIANGDFNDGFNDDDNDGLIEPIGWDLVEDTDHTGWEFGLHVAKADYSNGGGINDALGLFVRNTGGQGSFFGYATQELATLVDAGYYWNIIHITAWGNNDGADYNQTAAKYNSIAWYTISSEPDPRNVPSSEWRELFPDQVVCNNEAAVCDHLGRKETVYAEEGMYYHIKVGHKFGFFNAWTAFGIDDISLAPVEDTPVVQSGWFDDGDVTWDPTAPR